SSRSCAGIFEERQGRGGPQLNKAAGDVDSFELFSLPSAPEEMLAGKSFLDIDSSTYFGLYSARQRAEVTTLLTSLCVQFEFVEVQETEDRLRAWTAWDDSSAGTLTGHELYIANKDLERVGTKLVELYAERKFGA